MTDSIPSSDEGVYGSPPHDLVHVVPDAIQFSPLFPGSESLEIHAPASLSRFVILAPPGTIERRYTLALALQALAGGSTLVALAAKDKGGSRIAKELAAFGCDVEEEAKRHHRICVCRKPSELTGIDTAILEGAPRKENGIWTQPGVFSWNRIDAGSKLLLAHLPPLAGRGADFGAGLGYLSQAILESSQVKHITLVEIDRRAVDAARKNLDPSRVVIRWADLRSAELQLRGLDFIVTNPPFHDGGVEDRALGEVFIKRSAEALRPGGVCWLVANRHLPYEPLLKDSFQSVRSVVEENGYKIFEAVR